MDLIEEVFNSTKAVEAPKRYYYWATLSAISAVLKDSVWFDMGGLYNVYPNIYVLLYGPSGIRKGPAINLARKLVEEVDNTRIIDGRSSIEAVIKDLGTQRTREGKAAFRDCCGFVVASELSSSIISNTAAMDIMTDFYDRIYHTGEWNYRLKVGESIKLTRPTITWLSGTNEALFKEFVPEKNLNGGLIGRMFVISEKEKNTTNSLMFKTEFPDYTKLGIILKEIVSKVKGEFTMATDVRSAMDAWYNKFDKDIAPGLKDETGFVSRINDYVIKLSILISSARRADKIINVEDTEEAIRTIFPLIAPAKKVVNSVKKNDSAMVVKRALILNYLSNKADFKEERTKLLQNLGLQIDHEDLDKIATMMIQMNVLQIHQTGGTIVYRLKTERPEVNEWIQQYRS